MQYMVWLAWTLLAGSLSVGTAADEKYDELFRKVMECYPTTAALGITAVKDGQVVFNKAYGKANREDNIDNTVDTRFSIGSVTKQFTSYLAGKQIKEEKFTWTDKIRDVFEKYDVRMSLRGFFRNTAATVKDALTHMTGIKQCEWLLTDDRNFTRAEWMTEMLSHFGEQMEMRSEFYYNNWFYTLIGWLSELVGNDSFENQIKSTILEPLDMTKTIFVSDPEFDELTEEELATPYKEGSDEETLYPIPKRALQYIGSHNPAGGLVSTTGDMVKYMVAVIDAMNGAEGAKLDKEVLSAITEPRALIGKQLGDQVIVVKPTFPETFLDQGYGYGHIVGTYKGYKYMNHGGSTYGHYSYITFLPDLKMGVFSVISGNDYLFKDNFRIQKLMHIFSLDTMMGDAPWINTTTVCTFPSPWLNLTESEDSTVRSSNPEESPITSSPHLVEGASSYVGNYSNPVYPVLEIKEDQSGILKFTMGNSNGSIVSIPNKGIFVILNMPVDPLNLPEEEKRRVTLKFRYDNSKVIGLVFEMDSEKFDFQKNNALPNSTVWIGTVVAIAIMTFVFC